MPLSAEGRDLVQCQKIKANGQRCKGWACHGDPRGLCNMHGGITNGKTPVCRCPAYQWPHRRGSGCCNWPNEPLCVCPVPAGTRKYGVQLKGRARDHQRELDKWARRYPDKFGGANRFAKSQYGNLFDGLAPRRKE